MGTVGVGRGGSLEEEGEEEEVSEGGGVFALEGGWEDEVDGYGAVDVDVDVDVEAVKESLCKLGPRVRCRHYLSTLA